MAACFEVMEHEHDAKNNKNAGNDICDHCLENEQLVDPKKGDKASERH